MLVHDLLLARKGIALPATHGLRTSIERHKGRLTAELTKARIRRSCGSLEALKEHVESGLDNTSTKSIAPHPRWIRVNTIKTTLEEQLRSTFEGFEKVEDVNDVRVRGSRRVYIDEHIPNLLAIPASVDLTKSKAYTSGAIIFQDKASCFPAYLLSPGQGDGDIVDSCAAPGNKTTHAAAILKGSGDKTATVFAFEKDRRRAEVLKKMVVLAGSDKFTTIHGGQDFLQVDPNAKMYSNVGALLLDPSCSGSGIVGRDDMPELHLPELKAAKAPRQLGHRERAPRADKKTKEVANGKSGLKRKREDGDTAEELETLVDDDGEVTAVASGDDLANRLAALATFQLELLLHAMAFPAARKITYSTCSIHFEENESVVLQALESEAAKARGWRILEREDQIDGMKKWPVRGAAPNEDRKSVIIDEKVRDACIRANKGDEHGTMGFFLAGFVRDGSQNEKIKIAAKPQKPKKEKMVQEVSAADDQMEDDEEWDGFDEDTPMPSPGNQSQQGKAAKHPPAQKSTTKKQEVAKSALKEKSQQTSQAATKKQRMVIPGQRPRLLAGGKARGR